MAPKNDITGTCTSYSYEASCVESSIRDLRICLGQNSVPDDQSMPRDRDVVKRF